MVKLLERVGAAKGIVFVKPLYAGVILGDTTLLKALPEPSSGASPQQLVPDFAGPGRATPQGLSHH